MVSLGRLYLQSTSTLLAYNHPTRICVRNLEESKASGVSVFIEGEWIRFGATIPDLNPGDVDCTTLDYFVVEGLGLMYAEASIGGVTKRSPPIPVFSTPVWLPGYPNPTPDRPVLVITEIAGTHYMGVYTGALPRPKYVDFILYETFDGNIALLTRQELQENVQPVFRPPTTAYSLKIVYEFTTLEMMSHYLEAIGGYITRDLYFASKIAFYSLPAEQRIKLMLPFVNRLSRWWLFSTMVKADVDSKTIELTKVVRPYGLTPLMVLAIGATIALTGFGIALGVWGLKQLFKEEGDAKVIIPVVVESSNKEIEAMGEIAKTIVDALNPVLLSKPKDVVKQEIDRVVGEAKTENKALEERLTVTPPKPPTIVDRIVDFTTKGAIAIAIWELLRRR